MEVNTNPLSTSPAELPLTNTPYPLAATIQTTKDTMGANKTPRWALCDSGFPIKPKPPPITCTPTNIATTSHPPEEAVSGVDEIIRNTNSTGNHVIAIRNALGKYLANPFFIAVSGSLKIEV